ncbi:MAG: hypothetical protein ACJ763_13915 [Bdellovibrionia bacterium]
MRLGRAFHVLELICFLAFLQSCPALASVTKVLDPMNWVQVAGGPQWGYAYVGDNANSGVFLGAFTPIQPNFSPSGIVVGLPPLPANLPPGASPYASNAAGFSMSGASISVLLTATSTDNLYCHVGGAGITVPNVKVTSVPIELGTPPIAGLPGAEVVCWNLGKSYIFITISRFSITSYPDLALGDLQISQPGSVVDPSDGLLQVKPGVPIQVNVPVGGDVGLIDSTNETTTLVLQAGSQPPQIQTIRSEDFLRGLLVPFEVTFNESEKGTQTISATVSPNDTYHEDYLPNNTKSVQVKVGLPYKLALSLSQGQVYPDMSDIGQTPGNTESIVTAKLTTTSGSPISGETIQFSVKPKDGSGGHMHTDGRPIGHFKNDEDSCETLDDGTCTVIYTASKFGGIETISGELVESPSVNDSQDLTVKVPGLSQLGGGTYLFKCAIENCAGYKHQNFYSVQPFVDEDMFAIGSIYSGNHPKDTPLVVTDASLPWGGLYDHKNTWARPHTFHRTGTDVDIRSTSIPDDNKDSFESTACALGGVPVLEYPNQTNEHYHIYFNAYSAKLAKLCDSIL